MSRTENLINKLQLAKNQAIVLHSETNMYYISGYSGEGIVLVANGLKAIITDFRYTEQAENQASDFTVYMVGSDRNHNAILLDLLQKNNIEEIYFEEDFLSYRAYSSLKSALGGINLIELNNVVQKIREIKDQQEIDNIKKACKITSVAFLELLPTIKAGETEKQLTARLEYIMKMKGSEGFAFDTICAAGKNGSLPHAIVSDYKVQTGDMITFDFGAKYNKYCADMTRTIAVGTPSDTMVNVYEVVKKAQQMSKDALKAGVKGNDIDSIARDYIYKNGYEGRFGHGLGHCLGIDVHENPRLSQTCAETILENMIITVEPGVYLPGVGGVRIEDTCLVTKDGNIALTEVQRDLIIL